MESESGKIMFEVGSSRTNIWMFPHLISSFLTNVSTLPDWLSIFAMQSESRSMKLGVGSWSMMFLYSFECPTPSPFWLPRGWCKNFPTGVACPYQFPARLIAFSAKSHYPALVIRAPPIGSYFSSLFSHWSVFLLRYSHWWIFPAAHNLT